MNIGIDVDDVLADFIGGIVPHLNERYRTDISLDTIHSNQLHRVWKVPARVMYEEIHSFLEQYAHELEPYQDSFEPLHSLKDKGHTLHVVTSRPSFIREQTLSWLETYFSGFFENVHITNQYGEGVRRTKPEICLEHGITVLVDDNPEYAFTCYRAGINVIVPERPWNTRLSARAGIVKVTNWKEIPGLVERIFDR